MAVQKIISSSEATETSLELPTISKPVFLQGRWGRLSTKKQSKKKQNFLQLDVRPDQQSAPSAVHEYFVLHPAILMGLRYSLRWFWMDYREHEEMSHIEAQEQEQQKLGWDGPIEWPEILANKIWPFQSLWLVDDSLPMHAAAKARRKLFPRAVAGPSWFGSPQNDFVCIKPDPGEFINSK